MLTEIWQNVAALGDDTPALKRAIDAYAQACIDLMNAAGAFGEAVQTGPRGKDGQTSLETQIKVKLASEAGGVAQQAYAAIVGVVGSAGASYTIERQRVHASSILAKKKVD